MKKQMRDENLLKISELADRSVTDASVASVLLCYMMYRVNEPMDAELLYEIAVAGEIINYFTYQETLQTLRSNGSVTVEENEKGESLYTLTDKGEACARRLKTFAAKSYRDHIVVAAKRALERRKNRDDVKVNYIHLDTGCQLHVSLTDQGMTLLDLTLFTPDEKQAHILGERVLSNPSAFYHNVLQAAMKNEEEPFDLTDN